MSGVAAPVEVTQRGEVLAKIHDLVGAVPAAGGSKDVVEALGRFTREPSRATAITYMTGASHIERLLETLRTQKLEAQIEAWGRLETAPAHGATVLPIMDRVRAALLRDENIQALRPVLEQEAVLFATAHAPGRPAPKIDELTLCHAGDVDRLAETLRARIEPGKRIRVRFEILDREEG